MAKILIVDDEAHVREFLKTTLNYTHPTCEIFTATDGVDALARVAGMDLVMTDCIMPRMDGIQLCRQIRRLDRRIKVVLVTGSVPYAEVPYDLFDDIVFKPFTVGDIVRTINNLIGT